MRNLLHVFMVILLGLSLMGPRGACAADADAFSTLRLYLSAGAVAGDDVFQTYWDPKPGLMVEAETPFYLGDAGLGLQYFHNSSLDASVPVFDSAYLFVSWSLGRDLIAGLHGAVGINSGVFVMVFSGDAVTGDADESEVAFGLQARAGYTLAQRWAVGARGEYRVIMTAQQIEYVFVSIEVSRLFDSPQWLQRFLK